MQDFIKIRGAREHNLKNIDLDIPRGKLIVITGLSGSGKSSLAFDTLYAEGQRRYVESLSSYARQFLGLMEKPDVDQIEGLSPAISIDQKSATSNPRSTVGTVTEIYDYMRVLFARIGDVYCPECNELVTSQTVPEIVDAIMGEKEGERLMLIAPMVRGEKGEHRQVIEKLKKDGFLRIRVDGVVLDLDDVITIDKKKKHTIDLVIDRIVITKKTREEKDALRARLHDSVEVALKRSDGLVGIVRTDGDAEVVYSERFACPNGHMTLTELTPRMFSFNSPQGACSKCSGLGRTLEIDPDLIFPNKNLTLAEGAIRPWARSVMNSSWNMRVLETVGKRHHFSMNIPVRELSQKAIDIILYGTGDDVHVVQYKTSLGKLNEYPTAFEGVVPGLMRRFKETQSDASRKDIERYMRDRICTQCRGRRLKEEVLAVRVADRSIDEYVSDTVEESLRSFSTLPKKLNERKKIIAKQLIVEISARLAFLNDVGLSYLTIDRAAQTLSGGEAQRIRLATQIGSGLTGVLYILDEPTQGLHQRDTDRLVKTLLRLRDLDNTVIVVEHDEQVMLAADYIIDIGPGAGEHGGQVMATGTPSQIKKDKNSLTGKYLAGRESLPVPQKRRQGNGRSLQVIGATENNLKNIDVTIPLGLFVAVTGVSGSGKSSLVNEIIAKRLSEEYHHAQVEVGKCQEIKGTEALDKVINIDQSPIGRSPRSNPATYTGIFTVIRELFASTQEAKARGYKDGRFSFNVKGGRCESCGGDGVNKIEMHFLPDVYVVCEVCDGKRYNRDVLEIYYRDKNIADVLDMTIEEAVAFFANMPSLHQKLVTLQEIGLGYMRLGQSATTLSGGEAQRIKLASELSRRSTGRTMYILDEPTTGLHFEDVQRLLTVLQALVDKGNTVLVIEHSLDMIKSADWVIDLGPEGGAGGGKIVAEGTPEVIAKDKKSYTGMFLLSLLG